MTDIEIEVVNDRLGERLAFDSGQALGLHLFERFTTHGHWTLQYDDVTIRTPDGWTHVHRGDYALLHILAGVPLRGLGLVRIDLVDVDGAAR